VRAITDGFGVILAREETDEYGVARGEGSTQPFGFAGEVRDAETGFVYLRARMYGPYYW
jgi:RHS repeat-associated protein